MDDLYFEKIDGEGNNTFILIHNCGGDHLMFRHQILTLLNFGNIIQLDLSGHGLSKNINKNDISSSSQIIEHLINHYNLNDKLYLIGLNNGANIALNTAFYTKHHLSGLILIDPILFMNDNFIIEINDFIAATRKDNYQDFITNLVNTIIPDATLEDKHIPLTAFNKVDKKVLKEMFSSLIEWDKQSATILSTIKLPTLCILTDEHHCQYELVHKHAPHFELGKLVSSKCWPTLEVPEQLNAMIKRFISKNMCS